MFYQVPEPVALFPLNSTFETREIKNRVAAGVPSGVTLALGPDRVAGGSYEFSGHRNSFIEFPNSEGGPLDVRYSITMLCWVYHSGQGGPLFDYRPNRAWGVHLVVSWAFHGQLAVRFTKRDYSLSTHLLRTALAGGWKFVGATYDHSTGDAKLWVDGFVGKTLNIGAGLNLATQESTRMGVNNYYQKYFKGKIAQMQVYDKALTQEQIQTIQQQTKAFGEYVTKQKCLVEAYSFPGARFVIL